jgi:uncharacterized protein YbcV (DUF1398 family)
MFTLEEIEEIHGRLGSAETLSEYVRSLAALGVERYDSFVCDGHSEYAGCGDRRVTSGALHAVLSVAQKSDHDAFLGHLKRHGRGETSYVEMSEGLAESGIEKWGVDTHAMTMTFYDRAGNVLLVEQIQ